MNQDMYVEWLVKRKEPAYAWPARIGLAILCLISLFFALMVVWGILLFFAACVGTYFLRPMLNVEYEYLYVDGSFSIDKILGKSRRKKVMECSKDELIMVAPADSFVLKDYETKDMKVCDCSSGRKEVKPHALIYQQGGRHIKVLIEPNDKLLQAIRHTSPRKIVR